MRPMSTSITARPRPCRWCAGSVAISAMWKYQVPSPITRPIAASEPPSVRTVIQSQLAVRAPVACAGVRGLRPATSRRRTYSSLVGGSSHIL